jgi:RNA polymerase sigma-70 factor (ECF subfamily)
MNQQNSVGSHQAEPVAEDRVLVERCRNGDIVAWRTLYDRYAQPVFRFVSALGVPPDEREDAAQDVFVAVYRGLRQFRGEAQLSTWIYRIAARHASHLGRRRRVRSFLSILPWHETEPEPQPDPAEKASELRLLDRLLDKLSPKKRMVLVLFEIEGLGVNEIANVMGCPANTVWSRLRHARAELVKAARRVPT